MANEGAYPVDPDTDVGRVRLLIGDVTPTQINEAGGVAYYEMFSDAEIYGFTLQGGTSDSRAVGFSYLYLAGKAALKSKSVKDYDLSVDLTKRAADLRATAQFWFDRADSDDALSVEEGFEIVPTGTTGYGIVPEATIPQWGRYYTTGRVR